MKRLSIASILLFIAGVFAWRHHRHEEDPIDETERLSIEEPGLIAGWKRPL